MNSTPHPSLNITWQKPTFLLPLYGLCVLLGVSDSMTATLVMVIIMTFMLLITSLLVRIWPPTSSLAWTVLAITLTTLITLVVHAWAYALYLKLGLYLPLCVVGSLLLMRPELRDHSGNLSAALARALKMSGGLALAALVLSTGRELVGHGSLFGDAPQLLGAWSEPLAIQVFDPAMGFVLDVLAPGAFVALGVGVALYNHVLLRWRRNPSE